MLKKFQLKATNLHYLAIAMFSFILFPASAHAKEFLRYCAETGNCRVCDIVAQAIDLGKLLITGAAGLALVVIVWASIGFITSAGNPEKINAAKKQIIGAVLGVGIVFAAFQLVSIIIITFAVPTTAKRSEITAEEAGELQESAGLSNFLFKPWWKICDESELVTEGGKDTSPGSTANCLYWGDNTPCGGNKICCRGTCETECKQPESAQTYIETQQAAIAYSRSIITYGESTTRDMLDSRIKVKNDCVGSNTTDCVDMAGIPQGAIDALNKAAEACGLQDCIFITGGTEGTTGDNRVHVSHGAGLPVVDISYRNITENALKAIGLKESKNFESSAYTCEANGGPVDCSSARWMHVEFW